jgi:cytidine deaminase
MEIDWATLRAAATDAMRGAYAPYSNFPVGAAALVSDGRIVRGCNVENASYGLTLCAECGVMSALHTSGGGRLVALSCVDRSGLPLMPCGRCRQLLWEHGGPDLLIETDGVPVSMAELLPMAFDTEVMDAVPHRRTRDQPGSHLRDMLGRGTVFVHPDSIAGQRAWTAYWDGSTGVGKDQAAILDEAPTVIEVAEIIEWGLARTRRVIVVDADGEMYWAGEGPAPAEVARRWEPSE